MEKCQIDKDCHLIVWVVHLDARIIVCTDSKQTVFCHNILNTIFTKKKNTKLKNVHITGVALGFVYVCCAYCSCNCVRTCNCCNRSKQKQVSPIRSLRLRQTLLGTLRIFVTVFSLLILKMFPYFLVFNSFDYPFLPYIFIT